MSQVVEGKAHEEFSFKLFATTIIVTLASFVFAFWLLAPDALWLSHIHAGLGKFLLAVFVVVGANCFVEYIFHRYVLHKPVVPIFRYFFQSHHCVHHPHTRIVKRRVPSGKEVYFIEEIENRYPIERPEQKEASFFPWYSLLVFGLLATPFLVLLTLLIPSWPWFFAGYAGIALSLLLYEVFHAAEHLPLEKWLPLIEHKRWGGFWTKVYGFHLRHHAVVDCNEAISGFFLLPVADWIFGTCVVPETLYVDGESYDPKKFAVPSPRWPINVLDRWTDTIVKNRRQKAQAKG